MIIKTFFLATCKSVKSKRNRKCKRTKKEIERQEIRKEKIIILLEILE